MSRVSDVIEDFLKELMAETSGEIEIRRNEMANQFKCAPSQINYVITTRFSSEKGYYVESRRGGGGSIKISRIGTDRQSFIESVLSEQIGDHLNKESSVGIASLLAERGLIAENQLKVMMAAMDDSTLGAVPKPIRDHLRAKILKAMIVAAVIETT